MGRIVDKKIDAILAEISRWAGGRADISAVALVGSWARGVARADSDIDVMILTPDPLSFRRDHSWMSEIDWDCMEASVADWRDADYGDVWSRHVHLVDGREIEFGFGSPAWAAIDPIDAGTFKVISDGCRILFDPQGLLGRLVAHVRARVNR
jgi:hypothetical protein